MIVAYTQLFNVVTIVYSGSHAIAQAALKLMAALPSFPEC